MSKTFFDNYDKSIFSQANNFSEQEYEDSAIAYKRNYGRFMPENRSSRILDLGCGAGHFLYFLQKELYTSYEGIDLSAGQIEMCRRKGFDNVFNADAADYLKAKEQEYDLIVMNDVVEHMNKQDLLMLMMLARQALKPQGRVIVKTPNMANPFALLCRYNDITHELGFTEKSLRQLFLSSGFSECECYSYLYESGISEIIRMAVLKLYAKFVWNQGISAAGIMSHIIVAAGIK